MFAKKLLLPSAGLTIAFLVIAAMSPADERTDSRDNAGANDAQAEFVAVQKKSSKKKGTKKRKFRGRLPAYYAKSGVSQEQREKIYSIQRSYYDRIAELEKQLKDLKSKRDTEVEGVLTATQKKKVAELREAARKKRGSKKSKKSRKSKT